MAASILYFHGEQLLVWALVVVGVVTVALIVLSIYVVKVCKKKLGKGAYWIASIAWRAILIAGFLFDAENSPNSGPPTILAANRLGSLVRAQPDCAPFAYSGLAFYKGTLYVCTNLGLLEVENGKVSKVYRVQKKYSVVSGSWPDPANRILCVMDEQTHELLNFDAVKWRCVKIPPPEKGYYSRGDVLERVRPASASNGFRLVAGGSVWRWDSSRNVWNSETRPTRASES